MNEFIHQYGIILLAIEVINGAIMWLIISSATRSDLKAKHSWIQTEIIARIAVHQGVPPEEIKEIFQKAGLK